LFSQVPELEKICPEGREGGNLQADALSLDPNAKREEKYVLC